MSISQISNGLALQLVPTKVMARTMTLPLARAAAKARKNRSASGINFVIEEHYSE